MKKIFAIIPAVLLMSACGGKNEPRSEKSVQAAAPVAVQAITTAKSEWPAVYEASGTVKARTSSVISARVMGYVRTVNVQAGDHVKPGQLLVEIDARDVDTQIRQAEAARNEASSALQEVDGAIASAKAQLELVTVTHKRMEDLYQKKSISNQEFDEASAKLKVAKSSYEMAAAKKRQVSAKIAQADEAVQSAKIMRGYARITSPFAGVVVDKRVEPGTLASPGTPLLTIEQAGGYRLEVPVEESRLASIKTGAPVTVNIEALQKTLPARVSEVVPAVDSASRAFTVKIDLPAMPQLQSGIFARAQFALGSKDVIAIPASAVLDQGQVITVMVVEDGVAHSRMISTGQRQGDQVEVLSGLNAGEKVIAPRPAGLADGARVEVR